MVVDGGDRVAGVFDKEEVEGNEVEEENYYGKKVVVLTKTATMTTTGTMEAPWPRTSVRVTQTL